MILSHSMSSNVYLMGKAVQGMDTSFFRIVPTIEMPFGNLTVPWLEVEESKKPSNVNIPLPVSLSWMNWLLTMGMVDFPSQVWTNPLPRETHIVQEVIAQF